MARPYQVGSFELLVLLALIRLRDDAYGVSISRAIGDATGKDVALGSVSAALERLEDRGFVVSALGEPTAERGGRAKRYFKVTGKGLREARDTQRALQTLWRGLPRLEGGLA